MNFLKLTASWIIFWTGTIALGYSGIQLILGYQLISSQTMQDIKQLVRIHQLPTPTSSQLENKVPVSVEFPDLNHQVGIVPNNVIDGQWQVSEKFANYLIGSGVIGEPGNIVIYAHERPLLFSKLHQLGPGDRVILKSPDVVGEYQIVDARIVSPDNTDILQTSEQPILTLYTCNGWLDEDRLVVTARFVGRKTYDIAEISNR